MENPNFLKNKFNLYNSPEVKVAEKHYEEKIPNVFSVYCSGDGLLRLSGSLAWPGYEWDANHEFVFCFRKPASSVGRFEI